MNIFGKVAKLLCLSVFVFVQNAGEADSFEPITTSLAVGTAIFVSGAVSFYPSLKSVFFECCNDKWINPRMDALEKELQTKIHGQHLVIQPVVRTIGAHIRNPNPSKALVLSFHGWTGNGKNFVSGIIADHIYKEGQNSSFVNTLIATHHFPHASRVEQYKDKLQDTIMAQTKLCERSLFIFDEVDKQPQGLMDTIKPFLDHHISIGGLNFRKNIFIFLSNTGGHEIAEVAMHHWEKGYARWDLKLRDFEPAINKAAFNENGGLRRSTVLDKSLVSLFVPFLPLERNHVLLCIRDDLQRKGYHGLAKNKDVLNKVADELSYTPVTKLYSTTGCKRVSDKVDLIVDEMNYK